MLKSEYFFLVQALGGDAADFGFTKVHTDSDGIVQASQ